MITPTLHPAVQVAMTTRQDYVDTDLLDTIWTADDRIRAKKVGLATLGWSSDDVAFCDQIHTDVIHRVTTTGYQGDGDAMITDNPSIILQVAMSDCVPIVVVGERSDGFPVIAAIHSGRGPTKRDIAGQTIESMISDYSVVASSLRVRIGPSASWDHYEFGPEAYDLFDHQYIHEHDEKRYLDVAGCVYDQLVTAGVDSEQIQRDRHCTIADPDTFFSYRRDGKTNQSMYVWVRITDEGKIDLL